VNLKSKKEGKKKKTQIGTVRTHMEKPTLRRKQTEILLLLEPILNTKNTQKEYTQMAKSTRK